MTDERMNDWTDGPMEGRTDRRTERRSDDRLCGRVDGQNELWEKIDMDEVRLLRKRYRRNDRLTDETST